MIKRELIILVIVFLAVIFQVSFFPLFFSIKNIPDFVLISLLSLAIVFGFKNVWVWVIIAGLALDLFSFEKIGVSVVSLIFSCYIVSFFSRRVLLGEKIGGIFTGMLLVSVITFVNNFWLVLADAGFQFQSIWTAKLFFINWIGWKLVFNLILFFVILLVFKKVYKRNYSANNLIVGN